jgi:hypothetical protein
MYVEPSIIEEIKQRRRQRSIPDQGTFKYRDSTFSKLTDNLWMGGAPSPFARIYDYFDGLVLCAHEYQPNCFPDVSTIRALIRDDGSPMTQKEQIDAVRAAGKVIRLINDGMRILITCYAGLNRSGLVCAIVLCRGPDQMNINNAIELIRSVRGSYALSNFDFVDFLRAFCTNR